MGPLGFSVDQLMELAGLSVATAVADPRHPFRRHVEEGDAEETGLMPDMLVSLTAPKRCAKHFKGPHHFLGGRFVPPAVVKTYNLMLQHIQGHQCASELEKQTSIDVASLRENYVGYELIEEQANPDPLKQFQTWFEDAVSAGVYEPNAMTLATADADANRKLNILESINCCIVIKLYMY
ncbi:hypothetical protein R1sor_004119 [Riccia sorocarpa]|uniref:Pyridoxal 5'-phosphate synthase n=1 Tax=Riccia sorocarpa TaxID=122646 RepID=A0ABD3H6E4_9MARC